LKVESAEFVRSAFSRRDFLRDGRPEVAFVGRSNVGKSSLLNRVLGRRGLARTGATPGRTRAVNYFLVNGRFYFVDLPGYGYAKAGREERRSWATLIREYLGQAHPRVVQLVDAKVGATDLDVRANEYLRELGASPIVVATKIDHLVRGRRPRGLAAIREALAAASPDGPNVIPFSAVSGEGVPELWREIEAYLSTIPKNDSTRTT
jgi:GTP-binding protein